MLRVLAAKAQRPPMHSRLQQVATATPLHDTVVPADMAQVLAQMRAFLGRCRKA